MHFGKQFGILRVREGACAPALTRCSLSEQFDQNHNPTNQADDSDDELFKLVAQLDELFYFAFHFVHLLSLILLYHTDSSMSIDFEEKWLIYAKNSIISAGFR